MTEGLEALRDWCGSTRESVDIVSAGAVAELSATLDYDTTLAGEGELLPPCWHWLFFHEPVPTLALDKDGHPQRGGFLPPVPLPRRMWAGGRLRFHAPLLVGQVLQRVSTVTDVTAKTGRSGDLVFVTVNHTYSVGDTLCIEERQDIVYRGESGRKNTPAQEASAPAFDFAREVIPGPVTLFRYSALTFNSHRIHYDSDYAVNVEGYPGLVVQGPLTATFLLDLLCREVPGQVVRAFEFRGLGPLFASEPVTLGGRRDSTGVELNALNAQRALSMTARAEFESSGA